MRKNRLVFWLTFGTLAMLLVVPAAAARQADPGQIAGEWEIELDAEGEVYYLAMTLKDEGGKLAGTVSEPSGFFSDIPLTDIFYDGKSFRFKFTAPTPPDGMERVVAGDFEVENGKMEGFINVDDLGISAPAVATRKSPL